MRVTMSKNEFIKSLAKVQGIVERRNTLPILSYVLMSAQGSGVEIVSTDLEVGLKASYDAEVAQPGTVTIMAKKAFEIARELPEEEVEIRSEDREWVRLSSGRATFRMAGLPKEDFPDLPKYSPRSSLQISRTAAMDMVAKTAFAISHDQTRYALNGVHMEFTTEEGAGGGQLCRMVATDGHRLAMVERPCLRGNTEDRSVIVPRKAVLELRRVMEDEGTEEFKLDFNDSHVFFIGLKVVLAARLIEGQFPEYQQVVPRESRRRAVLDREEFGQVLRRVSILTADRSNPVRFGFGPDKMTVSTANPDVGEASESMAVDYQGEPIELGFNARYVLDALGAIAEPRVVMGMNEPLSPGLLTPEGDQGYRYVVMPMRL
jgi:DNA polymerase-3 subunit beta